VPVLSLVAAKTVLDVATGGAGATPISALVVGFLVSGVSAYLAVEWLLRWLRSRSMAPFAVYRVILGLSILMLYLR
jgi:undecaprenyl-diphosphatase